MVYVPQSQRQRNPRLARLPRQPGLIVPALLFFAPDGKHRPVVLVDQLDGVWLAVPLTSSQGAAAGQARRSGIEARRYPDDPRTGLRSSGWYYGGPLVEVSQTGHAFGVCLPEMAADIIAVSAPGSFPADRAERFVEACATLTATMAR